MGRGSSLPLRALPRFFLPGADGDRIALPPDEFKKVHNVLRLGSGDEITILPGDGRLLRCELDGKEAIVLETHHPETDHPIPVTVALALSKPDALEGALRMATEIGVAGFILFPSRRSVVRWDEKKAAHRQQRLEKIAREAAEVCGRTRLPALEFLPNLDAVLQRPNPQVLSEWEAITQPLQPATEPTTLVFGPEGGWAPDEHEKVTPHAVTLGPRVFRVDTAVAAACAIALAPVS